MSDAAEVRKVEHLVVHTCPVTRAEKDAAIATIHKFVSTAEVIEDLKGISRSTLDVYLLPPEQSWDAAVKRKVSRRQRVQ